MDVRHGQCDEKREQKNRLQALEMWLWRSLEKIKWQERISNDEVLKIVNESRCLIRTIGERKKNWIRHVRRGDGLLRNLLEGSMFGSKPRGRPRIDMIDELGQVMIMEDGKNKKESFGSMKRRAVDREGWIVFVLS